MKRARGIMKRDLAPNLWKRESFGYTLSERVYPKPSHV